MSHTLSASLRAEVTTLLAPAEEVLASLEVDLNTSLHFTHGVVLLTNRRLLAKMDEDSGWSEWAYRPGLTLGHHDHAGVGSLELHD